MTGNLLEPDVAFRQNDWHLYNFTIACKEINGTDTWLYAKDWNWDFSTNTGTPQTLHNVDSESNQDTEYGIPRIAYVGAGDNGNCTPGTYAWEIVMVENNPDYHYVWGYHYLTGTQQTHKLNQQSYVSGFDGNTYDPWRYPTKEPVVATSENIIVAWSYKSPYTGDYEIISRQLNNCTGEVLSGQPYSLVNGLDGAGTNLDQHHPCIASRFAVGRKFIGWYDAETTFADYKERHDTDQIFGTKKSVDTEILYPNPASRKLNVRFPEGVNESSVSVFSISGKRLFTKHLKKGHNTIDVDGLSPGVYIIEMKSSNKTLQKKFIKR